MSSDKEYEERLEELNEMIKDFDFKIYHLRREIERMIASVNMKYAEKNRNIRKIEEEKEREKELCDHKLIYDLSRDNEYIDHQINNCNITLQHWLYRESELNDQLFLVDQQLIKTYEEYNKIKNNKNM